MRGHHLCAAIALLVALSIGMRCCAAAAHLGAVEMKASRGGSAQAKDCTTKCNAWNDYDATCLNIGADCTVCSLGGNTVHYLDMAGPNCSTAGGFGYSPTRSQNCGLQMVGVCIGVGNCLANPNGQPCSAPSVVCPQGNCP